MKGFTLFSCLLCSFTVLVESHRFHSRQTEIASTYMQYLVAKQTHCSRTSHSICLQVFFPSTENPAYPLCSAPGHQQSGDFSLSSCSHRFKQYAISWGNFTGSFSSLGSHKTLYNSIYAAILSNNHEWNQLTLKGNDINSMIKIILMEHYETIQSW